MEEEQAEQKEPRVYVPARRFPAACLDASVPSCDAGAHSPGGLLRSG